MDKYKDEDINQLNEHKWQLLSSSFYPNKPLEKVIAIKNIIERHTPDIIMLVEVGGRESLDNFNKFFLDNKYEVLLEDSNSDRGIDLGYLCKKGEDFNFQLLAHTKMSLTNGKKFARGLFELRVKDHKNQIKLIIGLTHLKSKLDKLKKDFEGRGQRKAEVEYLLNFYKKSQSKNPDIPILLAGDFNGIISNQETEEELRPLIDHLGLKDILDLTDKTPEEKVTFVYFSSFSRVPMQLDYILIDPKFKKKLNKDETCVLGLGEEIRPTYPKSLSEKLKFPSDHYPILCSIDLNGP